MAAFVSYWVAGAIYTFPLVARFSTAFPQGMDAFGFLWNNWWIYYAVVHLRSRPYLTHYIFSPGQVDLRLHTFGLLYGLLSIPIMPLLGPIGVLNAQSLFTTALNGYAAFRLADYVAKDRSVAYISGLLIACAPAVNFHLEPGRVACSALWPATFVLYFGVRLLDRATTWEAILWGASLVATLLADQQSAMFCGAWLVVLALDALVRRRRDVLSGAFVRSAGIAAVLAVPFAYLLYLRPLLYDTDYTVPSAAEAPGYSVPLWGFTHPKWLWLAYGLIFPLALIVGVAMLRRKPSLWPWVAGSVAFLVLTMGPVLEGTAHPFPMPFALLQKLPGFRQFRTPYRFQMPAALGLSVVFAILGSTLLRHAGQRVRRWSLGVCIAIVVGDLIAHRIVKGFPTQTMDDEPVYEQMRGDPRDCLVLEIPFGVRTGTDRIGPGEFYTYYQPIHRKRLINGLVARVPIGLLRYYRESPALMFLAGEQPPKGDIAADLRRRLEELDVGYIVVHPAMVDPTRLQQILDLLGHIDGLVPLRSDDNVKAFRRDTPGRPQGRPGV